MECLIECQTVAELRMYCCGSWYDCGSEYVFVWFGSNVAGLNEAYNYVKGARAKKLKALTSMLTIQKLLHNPRDV